MVKVVGIGALAALGLSPNTPYIYYVRTVLVRRANPDLKQAD